MQCRHQKEWNKKGQAGGQERLKGLFMTVSEKAQGMAKSGLAGGVLDRKKAQNKQVILLTSVCPLQEVAKHKQDSSWNKRKDRHRGELAFLGTPQPSTYSTP